MKRIPKKIFILLIAIVILATGTVVFFACQPKDNYTPPPENVYTLTMAPPTDGSTPDDYSGLENLAYMAGKLSAREFYHTETSGLVDTITDQKIAGSKDYYKGILITESVSTSTFASVAQQKFYGDGKVVIRGPKYGKSKWDGINTEWSDGEPVAVLGKEQYIESYGLWASEFSDYVLNEETIIEVSDLIKTADGYFQQTFTLDAETATYYQKRNMRTMGGLDNYPSFSSAQITYTFDDEWSVIRVDIDEKYKATMVFTVSCHATTTITYNYEESSVDVSAFEDYFKNYANAEVTGEGKKELGVVDYLQKGFLENLTQGSVMNLTADVDGNTINGRMSLDIGLFFDVRAAIGDLVLNVDMGGLYIQYKEFCGKLSFNDLTAFIGGGTTGLDTNTLLEQIGAGEIVKDNGSVTINCSLALEKIQIPLIFRFIESEGEVTFVQLNTSLELGGISIGIILENSESAQPIAVIEKTKAVDIKPYVTSILGLVENNSFVIEGDYTDIESEFGVSGNIYVDANVPAVSGNVRIKYKSLEVPVSVIYFNNEVYLSVYDVSVKATTDYLKTAVASIFEYAEITLPDEISIEVSEIISTIVTLDYNTVVKELSLTENKLALNVNVDSIFKNLTLGDISVQYDLAENAFTLSGYGATAKLYGTEIKDIIVPQNAVDIKLYVDSVTGFVKDKSFDLAASYVNPELGLSVVGNIYINANVPAVQGTFTIIYKTLELPLNIVYVDNVLYLKLHNVCIKTTPENIKSVLPVVIEMTGISFPENISINTAQIIETVAKLDIDTILSSVLITDNEISLIVNADSLLNGFVLGDLTLKYVVDQSAIKISGQGLDVTLQSVAAKTVIAPEDGADYTDITVIEKFLPAIKSLMNTDNIAFELGFTTTILDIDMEVALSGEVTFAETLTELYIKAEIFVDGYANETVEVLFKDGTLTLVYDGYSMSVNETQLGELSQSLSAIFVKSNENTTQGFAAATLLFSEDGLDLNSLIENLRLAGSVQNGISILNLALDFGIIESNLPEIFANISTDGDKLAFDLTEKCELFGLPVNKLSAIVCSDTVDKPRYDFSSVIRCNNAFEFVLHAYTALTDTNYLNVVIAYSSEIITAEISGLFEFVRAAASEEGANAGIDINFDVSAVINSYKYDETNAKVLDGSHYINMVAVGDMVYISYSLFAEDNADRNPLYVKIPVQQLFEVGETVLPLLMPILGIPEDAFYVDFVTNLLSLRCTKFTTEICNNVLFADLLKLIDGIIAESGGTATLTTDTNINISEMLDIFTISKNDNGEAVISLNNSAIAENESLSVELIAQKEGVVTADTSKNYIDITSISYLLNDVLAAYEYADTGYELSGTVDVAIILLNRDFKIEEIGLNAKIGLDDEGNVFLNVNIKTPYILGVTNYETETDITIKDNYVYMCKKEKRSKFFQTYYEYSYDKITISEFFADILNKLFWAVNLTDFVKNLIIDAIENSEPSAEIFDTGDMVKGYSMDNNVYKATLNVGAIADDDQMGDLNINITREQISGRDYYDLTKINGDITFVDFITMNFNLTHVNPGEEVNFDIINTNIERVDKAVNA